MAHWIGSDTSNKPQHFIWAGPMRGLRHMHSGDYLRRNVKRARLRLGYGGEPPWLKPSHCVGPEHNH